MDAAAWITQLLTEGRVEDVRARYPGIPLKRWNDLVKGQPEGTNNKYLMWCAKQFAEHQYVPEATLALVHRFEDSKLGKDINALTFEQAEELLDSKPKSKTSRIKDELPIVYEDEYWKVYEPKTHEAMKKIGGGTQWCVATSNSEHWDSYWADGAFLVLKLKPTGTRFALYCTGRGIDVYDEDDTNEPWAEWKRAYADTADKGLIQFVSRWEDAVLDEVHDRSEADEERQRHAEASSAGWQQYIATVLVGQWNGYKQHVLPALNNQGQLHLIERLPMDERDALYRAAHASLIYVPGGMWEFNQPRLIDYTHDLNNEGLALLEAACYHALGLVAPEEVEDKALLKGRDVWRSLEQRYGGSDKLDRIIFDAEYSVAAKNAAEVVDVWGGTQAVGDGLGTGVGRTHRGKTTDAQIAKQLRADGYDDIAAIFEGQQESLVDKVTRDILEARKHPDYTYRNADDSARARIWARLDTEIESRIRRWKVEWDVDIFYRDGRPTLTSGSDEGELFSSKREAKEWAISQIGPIRPFNPGDRMDNGWA